MSGLTNTSLLRRRISASFLLAGGLLMLLGALAPSADAAPKKDDPSGSNGTVKIEGVDVDADSNDPQVGCAFEVDFSGFGASIPVSMVFEAQPPTGNEVIHTEEGVLDDTGAGTFVIDLTDALAGFEPQGQGFHVTLTITADDGDANGAQVKHKTFWATGCEPQTETTEQVATTEAPTTTGLVTTTEAPTTTELVTTTEAPGTTELTADTLSGPTTTEGPTTTLSGKVSGVTNEQSTTTAGESLAAPTTTDDVAGQALTGPEALPRTGSTTMPLVGLGAVLVMVGVASLAIRRDALTRD